MKHKSHWRERSKAVIAEVLQQQQGKTDKEIRAALRDAYPFGQRAMHPYKIWCDEVKVQLGLKKRKVPGRIQINNPNQQEIF